MMPVVALNLLSAIEILGNAVRIFDLRCARGVEANREVCHEFAMKSLGLATALNPLIGYRAAAEVVKQAVREGRSIPEVVLERGLMGPDEARAAFAPETLTTPGRLEARPREFAATEPPHAPGEHHHPAGESLLPESLLETAADDIPPP
jgi:fumarate hydratase class II/aspartate ammonia-lyase